MNVAFSVVIPEVAVTVTVLVPAGVVVLGAGVELVPPPQPIVTIGSPASNIYRTIAIA